MAGGQDDQSDCNPFQVHDSSRREEGSRSDSRLRAPLRRAQGHCAPALALALSLTGTLNAQTIRGRVTELGTGSAISGALLVLLSPEGEEVASGVSGESGAWVLRAPSPGEWFVRVERIGFASTQQGPFRVAAGAELTVPLEVSSSPLELPALTVESESGGCGLGPEEGKVVWRLRDEARKALRVAEITEGSVAFLTETTEPQIDP